MATENVNIKFGASLTGGTQATFNAMQKGFRGLAKELQKTAKDLKGMQQAEAANVIGHIATATKRFARNLDGLSPKTKKAAEDVKALTKAEEHFAKATKVGQEAFAHLTKDLKAGSSVYNKAVSEANKYDKGMAHLVVQTKALGLSTDGLNKKVTYSGLVEKERAGDLKITANGFTKVTAAGWKYLTANTTLNKSLRDLNNSQTLYNRALREASNTSFGDGKTKAIRELGKATQYSEIKLREMLPKLNQVESSIVKLGVAEKALTGTTSKWVGEIDRVAIVNQSLINSEKGVLQHVTATASGFKIFSKEGLKPFGDLTLQAAQKLGMLDKSFAKFTNDLKIHQTLSGKSNTDMKRMATSLLSQGISFDKASEAVRKHTTALKSSNKSAEKLNKLTSMYSDLASSSGKLGAESRRLLAVLSKHPRLYDVTAHALKRMNSEMLAEEKATKRYGLALANLNSKYKPLLTSSSKFAGEAKRLIASMTQEEVSIKKVGNGLAHLNNKYKDALRIQKQFKNDTKGLGAVLERVGKSFKTYASYMVSSALLQGMTQSFRKATDSIIEHDQGLHDLKAIMQSTSNEVLLMDDALLKVAKDTKFSVSETADAMKKLGQAGFTASEVVAGIPNVANLATGTLESLSSAVDLTSTAVRVFRMDMSSTGKVADIFANAVTKSRLTVHKLNTSFNYIGPMAKAAGMSLKETTGGMMLLANSGLRASTIGTGFRRVLTLLLKPTSAFKEAVKEAGYSINDFNPLMNSFSDILKKLPDVVGDSQKAVEMFGVRGSSVITAFTTQGSKEFDRLAGTLDNIGTAHKMAGEQMKGLGIIIKNIKDRFGVLAVAIGDAGFTDLFKSILISMRGALNAMIDFANTGLGKLIIRMVAATAVITSFVVAAKVLTTLKLGVKLATWTNGLMLFSAQALTTKKSMGLLTLGLKGGVTSFEALQSAALKFIATPLGAALAVVSVAVAVGTRSWMKYKDSVEEFVGEQAKFNSSISGTQSSLNKYNEAVKNHGKFSGEAKEALTTLKGELLNIETQYGKTRKNLKGFADEIDLTNISLGSTSEFTNRLSGVLKDELVDSLIRSTTATDKMLFQQQKLKILLKENAGTKLFVKGWKNIGFIVTKIATLIDNTLLKLTGFGGGLGEELDTSVKSINEATEAFHLLQEQADAGFGNAVERIEGMKEASKELAESLLKGRDASVLTTESIEGIVQAEARTKEMSGAMQGALVKALMVVIAQANKAKESIGGISKLQSKELAELKQRYLSFADADDQNYKNKVFLMEQGVIALESATQDELGVIQNKYRKEVEEAEKSGKDITAIHERWINEITVVENQGRNARLEFLQEKQTILVKQYEAQVKYAENYYKQEQDLASQAYSNELAEHKRTYDEKLAVLDTYSESEKLRYDEGFSYFSKYYQESVHIADAHYTELQKLAKKEFQDRIIAVKAVMEKEKERKEKVVELSKELLETQKGILVARRSQYATAIDTMIAKEAELTGKIKEELDARKEFNLSIEDKLRNIKYKTLDDIEIREKEFTRAQKLETEARKALRNGEMDTAKEKSKEAIDIQVKLAGSLDKSSISSKKYGEELKDSQSKIKDLSDIWNKASKGSTDSLESQITKVNKFKNSAVKLFKELTLSVENVTQSIKLIGLENTTVNVSEAMADLQEVESKVESITAELGTEKTLAVVVNGEEQIVSAYDDWEALRNSPDIEKTIIIREKRKPSGDVERREETTKVAAARAQTGKRIPGYGGGDTVDALLEKGEWVIRKEAVAQYGDDTMDKINKGEFDLPKFKTGGGVWWDDEDATNRWWEDKKKDKKKTTTTKKEGSGRKNSKFSGAHLPSKANFDSTGGASSRFTFGGGPKDLSRMDPSVFSEFNSAAASFSDVHKRLLTGLKQYHLPGGQNTKKRYKPSGDETPDIKTINSMLSVVKGLELSPKVSGFSGYIDEMNSWMAKLEREYTTSIAKQKKTKFDKKTEELKDKGYLSNSLINGTRKKFQDGGAVLQGMKNAVSGNRSVTSAQKFATGPSNTVPDGPTHSVTFNLGNEQHGPFKSDSFTMNKFMNSMKRDMRRS